MTIGHRLEVRQLIRIENLIHTTIGHRLHIVIRLLITIGHRLHTIIGHLSHIRLDNLIVQDNHLLDKIRLHIITGHHSLIEIL